MENKTDNLDPNAEAQDSLVDALESIQDLLEKSDSKLAAAKESIAQASSQAVLEELDIRDHIQHVLEEQNPKDADIPVLNDIVVPTTTEKNAVDDEEIPTLYDIATNPTSHVILDYLDNLEEKLEKTLITSLRENLISIETELKQSLACEVDKIREQIKKDFS